MSARDRFFARLWGTVEEPRAVTVVTVAAYLVTAMVGYSLLLAPPVGHDHDTWLRALCAMFLIGGGSVGIPASWSGARWLEAPAAFSAGAGMGITLTQIMAVQQEQRLSTPWVTVLALILCALFWVARYLRVKDDAYAPGKGPLLPEQKVAVREALNADSDNEQ